MISMPRNLQRDGVHNFVFSVCFGAKPESRRFGRVTIACQSEIVSPLQFDVLLGEQFSVQNIVPPNSEAAITVAISSSVGELKSTVEGRANEKIYTFFFLVSICKSIAGSIQTNTVVVDQLNILPPLSVSEKPKRPRGRPKGKRTRSENENDSPHNSPTSTSPAASFTASTVARKPLDDQEEEPPAATSATATTTSASSPTVEQVKKRTKKQNSPKTFAAFEEEMGLAEKESIRARHASNLQKGELDEFDRVMVPEGIDFTWPIANMDSHFEERRPAKQPRMKLDQPEVKLVSFSDIERIYETKYGAEKQLPRLPAVVESQ
jgi:hypothetical protein